MNCPKCQSNQLVVVDTRDKPYGIQRRRECLVCGHRFNTAEVNLDDYNGTVIRKCELCPWLKQNCTDFTL